MYKNRRAKLIKNKDIKKQILNVLEIDRKNDRLFPRTKETLDKIFSKRINILNPLYEIIGEDEKLFLLSFRNICFWIEKEHCIVKETIK